MTRSDASSAGPHETVSSFLGAHHEKLDTLFAEARRLAAGSHFEAAREAFFAFADGLERHIQAEETILFPAFDAQVPMRGPTMVMTHEHRAIEELIARGRAALEDEDGERFDDDAAELAELLHAHNVKEERVLYPRLDAALDAAARTDLVAELRRAL